MNFRYPRKAFGTVSYRRIEGYDIPPVTQLAIQSDPDLAIAKATASQDHVMNGCNLIDRILILILAKANSRLIDQKSTGSPGFASFHEHPHPPKARSISGDKVAKFQNQDPERNSGILIFDR